MFVLTIIYNLRLLLNDCDQPCDKKGFYFVVFNSGKAWFAQFNLAAIAREMENTSIKYSLFLGFSGALRGKDGFKLFFDNLVQAKYGKGVDLASCLLCQHFGGFYKPNEPELWIRTSIHK